VRICEFYAFLHYSGDENLAGSYMYGGIPCLGACIAFPIALVHCLRGGYWYKYSSVYTDVYAVVLAVLYPPVCIVSNHICYLYFIPFPAVEPCLHAFNTTAVHCGCC